MWGSNYQETLKGRGEREVKAAACVCRIWNSVSEDRSYLLTLSPLKSRLFLVFCFFHTSSQTRRGSLLIAQRRKKGSGCGKRLLTNFSLAYASKSRRKRSWREGGREREHPPKTDISRPIMLDTLNLTHTHRVHTRSARSQLQLQKKEKKENGGKTFSFLQPRRCSFAVAGEER